VCSLAYNRTGDLAHSEDLAQETFLAAWRQLGQLREPDRLRSWLCGIARNLIHNSRRRLAREPAHASEALDGLEPIVAPDPLPSEQAITREREAILWRALQRVPETYREPLILYYREQRSVERVAAELDLSEDAVRQRLSRGRRLLHEQVIAFVEGTLERTAPGESFTLAVVGTLPLLPRPARRPPPLARQFAKGGAAALVSKAAGAAVA